MGVFSKIIRKLESINVPIFVGVFSSLVLYMVGIWLSTKGQASWVKFFLFAFAIIALIFTKGKFFGAHIARLSSFLVLAASSYFLRFLFPKCESKWYGDCLIADGGIFEIVAFISIVLAYLGYFGAKRFVKSYISSFSEKKLGNIANINSEPISSALNNGNLDSKNFRGNSDFRSVGFSPICLSNTSVLVGNVSDLEDRCKFNIKNENPEILEKDFSESTALMAFDRKLCFFFSLIARFNKLKLQRKFGLGLFIICVLGHAFFGFANVYLYSACIYCNEANGGSGFVGNIYSWHVMNILLFYISILLAVVSFKVKYFGAKFVRFLTFFTFGVLNLMHGYFYSLNFKRVLFVLVITGLVYLFLRYIFIRLLIITKNGIYGV